MSKLVSRCSDYATNGCSRNICLVHGRGKRLFSFPERFQSDFVTPSLLFNGYDRLFPSGKPLSGAEIENERSCTITSSYYFVVCCLINPLKPSSFLYIAGLKAEKFYVSSTEFVCKFWLVLGASNNSFPLQY